MTGADPGRTPRPRPIDPRASWPGPHPTPPGLVVERDTWRPLRTARVGDWLLGFTDGLTRRANSAAPVVPGAALTDRDIAEIEHRYAEAGLPTVFRICSAAPTDAGDRLAARGYVEASVTEVWVHDRSTSAHTRPGPRSVSGRGGPPHDEPGAGWGITEAGRPDASWLDGWLGVKSATAVPARRRVAAELLAGSPARYLTARAGDGVVLGVLRVALTGDWAGLSCLAVTPRARRRGIGRALTRAGLDLAARSGSARTFLQVEVHNDGALELYRALGFRPAERYSYRER